VFTAYAASPLGVLPDAVIEPSLRAVPARAGQGAFLHQAEGAAGRDEGRDEGPDTQDRGGGDGVQVRSAAGER